MLNACLEEVCILKESPATMGMLHGYVLHVLPLYARYLCTPKLPHVMVCVAVCGCVYTHVIQKIA